MNIQYVSLETIAAQVEQAYKIRAMADYVEARDAQWYQAFCDRDGHDNELMAKAKALGWTEQ